MLDLVCWTCQHSAVGALGRHRSDSMRPLQLATHRSSLSLVTLEHLGSLSLTPMVITRSGQ